MLDGLVFSCQHHQMAKCPSSVQRVALQILKRACLNCMTSPGAALPVRGASADKPADVQGSHSVDPRRRVRRCVQRVPRAVRMAVTARCVLYFGARRHGSGFELSGCGEQGLFLIEAETSLESELGATGSYNRGAPSPGASTVACAG